MKMSRDMENSDSHELEIQIKPTARKQPVDEEQFSEVAVTALFNAHIATRNSERQAIWQRYNAMFLVNSIVIGVLSRETLNFLESIIDISFGICICILW